MDHPPDSPEEVTNGNLIDQIAQDKLCSRHLISKPDDTSVQLTQTNKGDDNDKASNNNRYGMVHGELGR